MVYLCKYMWATDNYFYDMHELVFVLAHVVAVWGVFWPRFWVVW